MAAKNQLNSRALNSIQMDENVATKITNKNQLLKKNWAEKTFIYEYWDMQGTAVTVSYKSNTGQKPASDGK